MYGYVICIYLFVLLYISTMIYDIFYYFFNFKERETKTKRLLNEYSKYRVYDYFNIEEDVTRYSFQISKDE